MTVILMFTILILSVSRDFTLYFSNVLILTEEDCVQSKRMNFVIKS